jgi:hypothetical protein
MSLNRQSSLEEKKNVSEAVFELLSDFFFDRINFISFPFTQVTETAGGYTSTTLFGGASRLTDTADGKFLALDKKSRTRCQFYVKNPPSMLGYVLSPVRYDSYTTLNTFSSMDVFSGYAGIKIDKGIVYVAVKSYGKTEILYPTDYVLTGTGESTTLVLEIRYDVNSVSVSIDNRKIGSFPIDLAPRTGPFKTFLALMSPAKSYDASGVNITIENYQFIQDK